MKLCYNLIPPANKIIALLVGALLLLSYSKVKAADTNKMPVVFAINK